MKAENLGENIYILIHWVFYFNIFTQVEFLIIYIL